MRNHCINLTASESLLVLAALKDFKSKPDVHVSDIKIAARVIDKIYEQVKLDFAAERMEQNETN